MEQRYETIERLRRGINIIETNKKSGFRSGLVGVLSFIIGVIAWIVALIVSWNLIDLIWILKGIVSFFIACFSAGVVGGIVVMLFDAPDYSSEVEEVFRRVCGFPINSYDKKQLYEIIELLESGQAGSFKEATSIVRTMKQHEQLLSQSQKMQQELERQTREMKKIKQESKEIKNELE